MRNAILLAKAFAILMVWAGLQGCGDSRSPEAHKHATASNPDDQGSGHSHDAPHSGRIVDLGNGQYHAELTHDDATHQVAVYILDSTAQRAAPIDAQSITINCLLSGQPKQFVLASASQPDDPPGKASRFELVSEPLCDAWDAHNSGARLNVLIAGRPYVGDIESHNHAAGHGHSHSGDDALVWRKELAEQGYQIALGHHGQALHAGHEVEPAVQITREGQPVADARVFNALLAADGQTVFAEEVATVYEPPTSEEPAHYAQGPLQVPANAAQVVLRYRIVLPHDGGTKTYDVPVAAD
jgi:hypothetical protein